MKELYISDLMKHMNEEVVINVLFKGMSVSQNRYKSKRQDIIAADKTGEIPLVVWGEMMDDSYNDLIGKVVKIMGQVRFYESRPEIQLIAAEELKEYDWTDYVIAITPETTNECIAMINSYIQMVEDTRYKALLEAILDADRLTKMAAAIGGVKHHNYCGGLIVHTVETCAAAIERCNQRQKRISPYAQPINKDLVITGALLHDVGALQSYIGFPSAEQTNRELLVGSCVDSVLFATTYNMKLPKEKRIPDLAALDHILLTAETIDDYGRRPRTLEAEIVNAANRESVREDAIDLAFCESDRKLGECRSKIYSEVNKVTLIRGV